MTALVERLDEIVERGAIERLQRKSIECGDEDRGRHLLGADGIDDFETALARHLHVEKHEIGLQPANLADSFFAVRRISHHFDAALPGQGVCDPLTRQDSSSAISTRIVFARPSNCRDPQVAQPCGTGRTIVRDDAAVGRRDDVERRRVAIQLLGRQQYSCNPTPRRGSSAVPGRVLHRKEDAISIAACANDDFAGADGATGAILEAFSTIGWRMRSETSASSTSSSILLSTTSCP